VGYAELISEPDAGMLTAFLFWSEGIRLFVRFKTLTTASVAGLLILSLSLAMPSQFKHRRRQTFADQPRSDLNSGAAWPGLDDAAAPESTCFRCFGDQPVQASNVPVAGRRSCGKACDAPNFLQPPAFFRAILLLSGPNFDASAAMAIGTSTNEFAPDSINPAMRLKRRRFVRVHWLES